MEDTQIIQLYFQRSEQALVETDAKYGRYCRTIALNILNDLRDCEECVNDTYLNAWNAIPPTRPACFSAFLGKITRNLSLNRLKARQTLKRGQGQYDTAYEELAQFLSHPSTEEAYEDIYRAR